MGNIKAIETVYKGYRFRSRLDDEIRKLEAILKMRFA